MSERNKKDSRMGREGGEAGKKDKTLEKFNIFVMTGAEFNTNL